MFNNNAKFLVVLSGFVPVFLICWLVKTIQNWHNLSVYLKVTSIFDFLDGLANIWINHWLLILFIITLLICYYLLNFAKIKLGPLTVTITSLKPAEVNFTTLLFSMLAAWLKYYFTDTKDLIMLGGTLVLYLGYAFTFRDSYHYNLTYKIFFGYRFYEAQIDGITYLLITKKIVSNIADIDSVKTLTDYMLIDVTIKPDPNGKKDQQANS